MKRGYTLVEFLIVLSVVGVLAAIVVPQYNRARKVNKGYYCASNLKQIGLGLMQYAQDYDEILPPAALTAVFENRHLPGKTFGWVDAIQPYVKSYRLFYCGLNEVNRPTNLTQPNVSDYYLNRNLAGRNYDYILKPESVLWAGEGNDGHDISNARYSRTSVPQSWLNADNSPLLRHARVDENRKLGGYYLFLDGHVKYLAGTSIDFGFRSAAAKPKKQASSTWGR